MKMKDSTPASLRSSAALPWSPVQGMPRRMSSALLASKSETIFLDEAEDARITGMTRSLGRRLLALNVRGTLPRTVYS